MHRLPSLGFRGSWRHYQDLALEAFERDRAAGRLSTHLVVPPGSGKTLLGFEILRRLGSPALVLAPNTAIQAQWTRTGAAFGAAAAWTGAAARRRARELARVTASLKRAIARGEHAVAGAGAPLVLADLLAPGARERVDALRAGGVRTVVLDECHHLASMWGYVVRAVLDELGAGVHVVGLTATPPDELTTEETELYAALLGPVDFQVPTPAVVRDGHLAPFQELAWLTEPLDGEQRWLDEHETRFRELVGGLLDVDDQGPLDLGQWVITRLRHRTLAGRDESEVPWTDFQRRHPALAAAGVRFLGSAGLPLPPGAPRGEAYRRPPDLADWVVLLEDWCCAASTARRTPRPARAARRSPPPCATSATSSRARGSGAPRRTSTGS
jgi:superfamily II DNA or RNA helicase